MPRRFEINRSWRSTSRTEPSRFKFAQSIRNNRRRMAGIMEEVLLIGSFDSGRMEFKPASLELGPFARRLVDEV